MIIATEAKRAKYSSTTNCFRSMTSDSVSATIAIAQMKRPQAPPHCPPVSSCNPTAAARRKVAWVMNPATRTTAAMTPGRTGDRRAKPSSICESPCLFISVYFAIEEMMNVLATSERIRVHRSA